MGSEMVFFGSGSGCATPRSGSGSSSETVRGSSTASGKTCFATGDSDGVGGSLRVAATESFFGFDISSVTVCAVPIL